jgi:dephospho-CoA kinase
MIKVGITGGIGSGKSMICKVFLCLGVPVYHADIEAKVLMNTDSGIRNQLTDLLGEDIYTGDSLDRQKMAGLIFNNSGLLLHVNKIIHPRVTAHFQTWLTQHANQPYIIQESAILFESNTYRFFDKIVTVASPEEIRVKRVISREGMTVETVQSIMQNQMPEEDKISRSHHVIINDENKLVLPQILKLHAILATAE